MAAVDDDIRADFLVEAGELLERLGPQLVELEHNPRDPGLLNAIFRAFHTVKGGAGFLNEPALVELCHSAEEVFGALRAGKREIDAPLMDAVLAALDHLMAMMDAVREGDKPQPAPRPVIQALAAALHGPAKAAAPVAAAAAKPAVSPPPVAEDPADAEFEQLLAQAAPAAPAPAASGDAISDDEFEALLDQLHGKGAIAGPADVAAPVAEPVAEPAPVAAVDAGQTRRRSSDTTDTSVRVDTVKLDTLMNLVGELVLARNRIKTLRGRMGETPEVQKAVSELDALTSRLQGSVLTLRMQPIKKVFSRFPKLVRDLARGLGKQIEVVMEGEDTDLDKNLVDALADPLVHMVRNACDHGVEMPEVRVAAGKPAQGHLYMTAQQEGDHILITVRDDGGGIDAERLRSKVVEKGLISAADAARLDTQAALELIFLPGFSTKEQVSDLSGRGVGMDVVKSSINALGGTVSIESRLGVGTVFRLRVPLTLAILPTLMVSVVGRIYAVPLPSVAEVCALDKPKVRWLDNKPVLLLRDETLRLIDLARWVNPGMADDAFLTQDRHIVVVKVGEERVGLLVDQVRGREEVVIKPLGAMLKGLAGFAGATVTGDGRVALILDVPSLVNTRLTATR